MPELPDVEVYRKTALRCLSGKKADGAAVKDSRALKGKNTKKNLQGIKGRLGPIKRQGKNLFFKSENRGWFVMHFGMTGRLECVPKGAKEPDYSKVIFSLSGGSKLVYIVKRMLGKIESIESPAEYVSEKHIGKDFHDTGPDEFRNEAEKNSGSIKQFLMDQSKFSGIGNIYSDEILFQSGIHPAAKTKSLSSAALGRLHKKALRILNYAVEKEADPEKFPGTWLIPSRKKGAECPKCKAHVQKTKSGGRSAYVCPKCQKKN